MGQISFFFFLKKKNRILLSFSLLHVFVFNKKGEVRDDGGVDDVHFVDLWECVESWIEGV